MSGPQYYASSGLPPPQGQGQSYGDPLGKNSAFIPPSAPSTLATQVDSQVGSIYSGEPQKDVPMPPESASPSPPGYQAPPQYAQQGPPPQGYPPQGYPPQGYPPGPQGYAQGPSPQGYAQGPPPQGYPPQGYPPPQGFVQGPPPQGYPLQGYPQGYPQGPPAYGPQGGAPLPSSPQPYPGGPPPNGNWATPAPGAPGAPGAVPAGDPSQAFSETTQWAQNLAPMPSNDQVSTAKIETSHSGVESDDACLNDKDQALLFFTNYNTRPGLAIQVHGTHTEHYTTTSRDSQGHTHTHHHTRTVTDFRYGFNISNHVMEGGVFDARPKVGLYLASSNVLKRCRMIKKVNLDFESIRASIINRIRSLGYMHTIMVTPCYSNHMVVINNSDDCSKCLRSGYTTCLCWLTCACIVWYPIKWFMQGRSDGDQDFESVFQFDSSTEMLLQRILPCCGAWGTYYSMTI